MKKTIINTFLTLMCILGMSSCATSKKHHLYADFIGFSDNAVIHYAKKERPSFFSFKKNKLEPFDLNSYSGKERLQTEIESQVQGTNTCATYALDIALDRIEYVKKKFYKKNNTAKFYIVMLTDGIDNNSVDVAMTNKRIKERDLSVYQDKLQERMTEIFDSKKSYNPFQSYVLLYKGADLKASEYTDDELITILTPYTGSKNAPRPNPILDDDINRLLHKFTQELKSSAFTFRVPKSYRNKCIKMYLNDTTDESERLYFEAEVISNNKKKEEFSLKVINKTLEFNCAKTYFESDTWIDFTINNVRKNGELYEIDNNQVEQWVKDNSGKYRKNSEYSTNLSQYKDAYILVILDSSKSFEDVFEEAQKGALKIVNDISDL